MDPSEVIEISDVENESDEESSASSDFDRRALLEPVITRVVDALGGYENGVYRMGDEAYGCLKDLKKLWRKDDTDDERTAARIFWQTRVLPNDLVPLLLATSGAGHLDDKRAVACADLITAMTWPIDLAEELRELDEERDKGADYTQLVLSHVQYKAALLRPGVVRALLGVALPALAKHRAERTERDGQVVNVVLHCVRNLSFIRDPPRDAHGSAERVELAALQSRLVCALEEAKVLRLLLTVAANVDRDPLYDGWNTLVLEIFYLLFRGVKPGELAMDQAKQPSQSLHRLLEAEQRIRRDIARNATSRHSRFGTTISVKLNPNKKAAGESGQPPAEGGDGARAFVLHRQQALTTESGNVLDMTKRQKAKKGNKVDELAREDYLSMEARVVLQNLAMEFLEACFNPFLAGLLKDIRSERPKITEKDNLRLLYVTKWFLEFFLCLRAKEKEKQKANANAKATAQASQAGSGSSEKGKEKESGERWDFGLIAEVTEREWIVWVLKRMREAAEEKPKLWTELQAGIECLTQLLLLIDGMSVAELRDPALNEAADLLQQQLIYNGEVLDLAFESLRTFREGTQSLAYLESSVHLAYALLRMMERWGKSKGKEMYVRKKRAKKRAKAKAVGEEEGIPDVEEEEEQEEEKEMIHETLFTFEAFEMKFAHADIAHTLLTYLARYKEFTSPESMRRVVSLMHRQAVRAKAEGLYFNVSTLDLFKSILADQKSFPRDQPYVDLVKLVNFILRQFFKALSQEPFLAIEAFFPKNRGHWKQYSSWESDDKEKKEKVSEDTRFPPEVRVKKGHSWSDQLGITIAALVDAGQAELVRWTKDILAVVIAQRKRIIEETDAQGGDDDDGGDGGLDVDAVETRRSLRLERPSQAALAKIMDYMIPYLSDEHAGAATKNPHLKLLFRLAKFSVVDEGADEWEWYVPSAILPTDLQNTLTVINQFLETPIDLKGKKASELLRKKARRRRRRSPLPASDDDALPDGEEDEKRKKKEKKAKEKQAYKSAQFIEDSDAEYGDIDAFLEKEKERRERARRNAEAAGDGRIPNMKPTGTKKRRRKAGGEPDRKRKKRKGEEDSSMTNQLDDRGAQLVSDTESRHPSSGSDSSSSGSESDSSGDDGSKPEPVSRPRPRPISRRRASSPPKSPLHRSPATESPNLNDPTPPSPELVGATVKGHRRVNRLVLSDDDDDGE